jgi:hypothetical protein
MDYLYIAVLADEPIATLYGLCDLGCVPAMLLGRFDTGAKTYLKWPVARSSLPAERACARLEAVIASRQCLPAIQS